MGANQSYGQLGNGTHNQTNRPQQILASNVTAVAAGDNHSLFRKSDSSLWGMGDNSSDQLGLGSITSTNRPGESVTSNVVAIAAGDAFSLFLKNDGSLWAMGENFGGQLGNGTTGGSILPTMIVASNVTAVAGGGAFSLFLKNDGSLWDMGSGGIPTPTNQPIQIVASGVIAIAAGSAGSTLFSKGDGSLWAMGTDLYGQLGDGRQNTITFPEQILGPYNQISSQPIGGGNLRLSFEGIAGTKYALDRSFSLASPDWIPQVTNPANSFGALVFTNTPSPATNNFWRIRSVP